MHNTLFYIILLILVVGFLFEQLLEYLNRKNWSDILPEELRDVFDAEEYSKSRRYNRETDRFALITGSLNFIIILLMLLLGGFALADQVARQLAPQAILTALMFFGMLMLISDLINTPFSWYSIFVIEEKYGFNKTTRKTFILDKLKGWLLAAVIGGLVLSAIAWFYLQTRDLFWIYAWILSTAFMIFMLLFYSNLIVPLFNKQTPLESGELRTAIEAFAHKAGFALKNIYVIDGSKRSTKANAYFTGLGPKKRIVLFDTLIQDLSIPEIVAVLAHEIGHYKKKHTLWGLLVSIADTGATLFILSLFISRPALSAALGAQVQSFHMGLVAFGILYSPVSLVVGLASNVLSRKNEYAADRFAAQYGYAGYLISGLKKLSKKSLSNLTPHPLYVFFHYSHPTLLQRIRALKNTGQDF